MGYLNPMEAMGYEQFADTAKAAGIDGILTVDLPPEEADDYNRLLIDAELDSIMLAHVSFPNVDKEFPASLSKRIITGWLRGQLGFDHHLVLTDDLDMGAIANRYGRGEDVKLAISAGNDLAMICHQTDSAEIAAKAIAELPIALRDDSKKRLARFRKKMVYPPSWSDKKWTETCEKISAIAKQIPEIGEADERSAVTKY
jgi:beta-N-acetylhexosaminidase